MWLLDRKSVSVDEFASPDVAEKWKLASPINSHSLDISPIRLSAAVARTVLSRDPTSWDLAFEAAAALFLIQTSVAGSKTELRLTERFKAKYRDFSGTGRIGTLSQAICYLFAQDVLGYPLVMDFDGFVESQNGNSSKIGKMKRPDFAIARPNDTAISVLESSSSLDKKMKSLLRKGLAQTANAKACFRAAGISPSLDSSFSFGAVLRDVDAPVATELAFCDPPEDGEGEPVNMLAAARRSYAAWFSYGGYFSFAQGLVDGDRSLANEVERREFRGRTLVVPRPSMLDPYPWRRSVGVWTLPFYVTVGIDEAVFDSLFADSALQLGRAVDQFGNVIYRDTAKSSERAREEVFRDGTVLFYEEI